MSVKAFIIFIENYFTFIINLHRFVGHARQNLKLKGNAVSCVAVFLEYGLINDSIGYQIRNHLFNRGNKKKTLRNINSPFYLQLLHKKAKTKQTKNNCVV
jgi:hypothetical protein